MREGIKHGHPLRDVPELSHDVVKKLAKQSISTSEEFLSQYTSNRDAIVKYLGKTPIEVKKIVDTVSHYLDPELLQQIYSFRRVPRYLGARRPQSKEDEEYLVKRRSEDHD